MDRVLAFMCHPDDVEFQAAGTLALLAERGLEIHLATMAGGEVGSATQSRQEIRARRLKESAAAAAVLGGTYHYAGGHDLEVQYDETNRRKAVRVMREVDPKIVIAPPPSDYLVDHEETSRLVRNAAFIAAVPHFDCGVPTTPTGKIPYLYYCNALGMQDVFGRELPLQMAVDITGVLETKKKMLACHESQREWLKYVNGLDDYLETMEAAAAREGARVGVPYAESFIQHLGFGHPTDNVLGEILGDLCLDHPAR